MRARKEMRSVTQGPLEECLPFDFTTQLRRMRARNKHYVLHLYGGPYPPIPNGILPHPWTLLTLGVRT